jgi:DNA-binding PadR family transcriptional regulator
MAEKPPFRVTPAMLDVLEVLLTGQDGLYGLKISRLAKRPNGSVVPILMRLENCGWVTSEWETPSEEHRGSLRRFYKLNSDALPAARALLAARRPTDATGASRNPRLAQSLIARLRWAGA